MQIFDSHSHLDFSEFDKDRDLVIKRAIDVGVNNIIISSTTAEGWNSIKEICMKHPSVCHPAYGLHPMFVDRHQLDSQEDDVIRLKSFLENNTAVAIGEIGLDFFIDEADEINKKAQIALFESQLELANECKLPVIIHARKSLDIVLKYLRKFPSVRGSIHSFSGSEQQAKRLIDLGFYLSFGGPITYSRATRLQKLIQKIPIGAVLVETDSPDLPDESHHAMRNEPAFIIQVIDKIAELKNIDRDMVAKQTAKNAIQLFKTG